MKYEKLLGFANTPYGRNIFGVPKNKRVIKIAAGSIHYLTGEVSKKTGSPIICAQGSPGGVVIKKTLKLLEFYPAVLEMAKMGLEYPFPLIIAADTGLRSPSATGGTNNEWTNPERAYSSNDEYATATCNSSTKAQTYENFGISIPGGVINGIEVLVEHEVTAGAPSTIIYAKLYCTSQAAYSSTKVVNAKTTEGTTTVGSSSNTWGKDWVANDFSNDNFHLYISFSEAWGSDQTMSLDHIQIRVYYTEPTSQTVQAKGRVKESFAKAVTAKANIRGLVERTVTAKGGVRRAGDRTISAEAAIKREFTRVIAAKAHVNVPTVRTVQAKASLVSALVTILAKANIRAELASAISASAYIYKIDLDYGFKVSKPGYDVKTAAEKDLIFSSALFGLKIAGTGSVTYETGGSGGGVENYTAAHGKDYIPAFLAFAKRADSSYWYPPNTDIGADVGAPYTECFFNVKVDATNLTFSFHLAPASPPITDITVFYIIFVEPAQ